MITINTFLFNRKPQKHKLKIVETTKDESSPGSIITFKCANCPQFVTIDNRMVELILVHKIMLPMQHFPKNWHECYPTRPREENQG